MATADLALASALAGGDAPLVFAVTTEAEYRRRHIRGAIHFDEFDVLRHTVARTRLIVLTGCAATDLTCAWAFQLLAEMGFSQVRVHTGGIDAWVAAGHPIDGDETHATRTATALARNSPRRRP